MPSLESVTRAQRWLAGQNVSGEEIPPFACGEINGVVNGLFQVQKPTLAEGTTICFAGENGIPTGRIGDITQDFPTLAYTFVLGATIPGQLMSVVIGQWYIGFNPDRGNLKVIGAESITSDYQWVMPCNRCRLNS